MHLRRLLAVLVPLGFAPVAAAAVPIAGNVMSPALAVDASGNTEVSWLQAGAKRTALLHASGTVTANARLGGADVSEPMRGTHVPWQRALRAGPGGWYYALQSRDGELRVARWRGVPTEISLKARLVKRGVRVSGFATLNEQRLAPEVAGRATVVLEKEVDGDWQRVTALKLNAQAAFSKVVARTESATYRVLLDGPGLAPDAVMEATAYVLDNGH